MKRKNGKIKNTNHTLIDLPGIYSLSPYSLEEEISRKFIFSEKPEVIINLVDATSLERSLYLTTQLLELDIKIIVAINMSDILEKRGIYINIEKLEQLLKTKVIKISALDGTGTQELVANLNTIPIYSKLHIYEYDLENKINLIKNSIKRNELNKRFISVKLLEADESFKYLETYNILKIRKETFQKYNKDLEEIIATQRYKFVEKVKHQVISGKDTKENISDKLDKIFLNKWLGIPIFIIIMFFIYYIAVGIIGQYSTNLIESYINNFSIHMQRTLNKINISDWLVSLIIDGIIKGVGAVLTFVPQLIILFASMVTLENTGYMARITFILDKIFRKIGLNGKSLIPFIIGSGCSVPGIMGTRIIENQDEREMTVILTPFIPCSAKLPIITIFSSYFFRDNSGLIAVSLYFISIIIIIISAIFMKQFIYKEKDSIYVFEMPEYRLPNIKYIFKDVYDKTFSFIKRAGSVILISSIVLWFLLSFSFKMEYGININESILAYIGKSISWIFTPIIGVNSWEATVSILQGLIAKEQVISSMSIISGMSEQSNSLFSDTSIFNFFNPISAYSFMMFNLFSAPCFGAIAAMNKELYKTSKTLNIILFQVSLAWFISTFVYQIGIRIKNNAINIIDFLVVIILFIAVKRIVFYIKNYKCKDCSYYNCCHKKSIKNN